MTGPGDRWTGTGRSSTTARRGVLEDSGLGRETTRMAASAGGDPVAGFSSYGEIARTSGTSGFHNHTLVVLGLG